MIQLRPFHRADIETLYKIDHICFAPGIAYSKAELRYYLQHPKSHTVVAETEAKDITGFCTGWLHLREGVLFGHVITIDVLPAVRRRGVGRRLMQAIEKHFLSEAVNSIQLEVAVDNLHAQAFYQVMGYERTGTLRGYYAGKLDALVMEKRLTEAG